MHKCFHIESGRNFIDKFELIGEQKLHTYQIDLYILTTGIPKIDTLVGWMLSGNSKRCFMPQILLETKGIF